jgi:hypothetical protein
MRSGALGLGAGFSSAAGAIADSLGAPEFSQRAYATADDLSQQAAAAAPRVTSIRDIGAPGGQGFGRDLVDWGAGVAGNVVPSAALGIGAGLAAPVVGLGGLGGALAAGTAAYALPETGDVVSRMRALGQPVDTGKALGLGTLSAAGQSIVPGLVGAKLAGQALRAGPMTLRQAGGSLATSAGLEGGSEGGAEALKQAGLGQDLDWGQIVDNTAAGVVGGTAMGGLGVAGEYAHSRAGDVSKGLQGAKDAATGLLGSAKDKLKGAKEAAGTAQEKLKGYGFFDDLGTRWSEGTTKAKDTLRKIADSEDIIGDAQAFAGATGDKLKDMLAGDDGERAKAVRSYYDELTTKNLSPENKAVLDEWVADPGNHLKQAAVAGLKRARDGAQGLRDRLKAFANKVEERADELKTKAGGLKAADLNAMDPADAAGAILSRVKKSEDYSAADAAVLGEITSLLQESRPELFTNAGQEDLLDAGRAVRKMLKTLTAGDRLDSDTVAEMIDILGPKTTDMIEAGYRAVGDKAKSAKFFEGLGAFDEAAKGHTGVVSGLRAQLKPQFQKIVDDAELGLEAQTLRAWATEGRKKPDDPEFAYRDRKTREALAVRYENPEAVMGLIEADLPERENQIERARLKLDEDGNVIGTQGGHGQDKEIELSGQKLQLHTAKGGLMYERAGYGSPSKFHQPAVEQRKAKLKEGGKADARELSVDELGADHPIVQITRESLIKRGEDMLKRTRLGINDEATGHLQLPPTDKMKFESAFERDVYDAVRIKGLNNVDVAAMAEDALQEHVVLSVEVSDSPQSISPDELDKMRLDTHQYGKSKSRLNTGEGGPILDGMRVQRFMQARFKDEYVGNDEKSRVLRMGRMFIEGVAAAQEHLGYSFPVPDSTVIGRLGGKDITFGDARKYDVRTKEDKTYDSDSERLTVLRKAFRDADNVQRKKILKEAGRIADERDFTKNRELTADDNRTQGNDETGFEGDVERGLSRRLTHSRKGSENMKTGEVIPDRLGDSEVSSTPTVRQQRVNELLGDLSVLNEKMADGKATPADRVRAQAMRREVEELLKHQDSQLGSGRKELDPFGPTHDALRGDDEGSPIYTDSGEPRVEGVRAPSLLGVKRAAPKDVLTSAPNLDAMLAGKDFRRLKTGADVDRFLQAAEKRYAALKAEDTKRRAADLRLPAVQRKALATLDSMYGPDATIDPKSFYKSAAPAAPFDMPGEAAQRKALADEYEDAREQPGGASAQTDKQRAWLTKLLKMERQLDIVKTIDKLTPQQLNGLAEYVEGLAEPPAGVPAARFNLVGQYIMDKADAAETPPLRAAPKAFPPRSPQQRLSQAREELASWERAVKDGHDSLEQDQVEDERDKWAAEVARLEAEVPPSPKVVAAKKAALLEKARSGDAALLKTLASSNDAAGLQRAAAALNTGKVDANTQAAIDAANTRLGELVQNPDVAYGLQTKRYSLMGFQLHAENQYEGFPATHDSPIRHEGKFDWRAHQGKGEGNAAFGAGTYLSTAEGTHKGYKKQFTAKAEREGAPTAEMRQLREALNENSEHLIDLMQERDVGGAWRVQVGGRVDYFDTQEEAQDALNALRKSRVDRIAALKKMLVDKISPEGKPYNLNHIRDDALPYAQEKLREEDRLASKPERLQDLIDKATDEGRELHRRLDEAKTTLPVFSTKAPTYEVTVNIPQEQLLDWNRPLNTQSEFVQEKLRSLAEPVGEPKPFEWVEKPALSTSIFDGAPQASFLYGGERYEVSTNSIGRTFIFKDGKSIGSVDGQWGGNLREIREYMQSGGKKGEYVRAVEQRYTGEEFYKLMTKKLGSQAAASDFLQSLGILGNIHDAQFGNEKRFRNYVIYDDSKIETKYVHFDKTRTAPSATGPVDRRATEEYLRRVAPWVLVEWKNFLHAGEFEPSVTDAQGMVNDVIRLSVHSLNPLNPAYHESLHAFFERLRDLKQGQVMDVLEKAGSSAAVMNQLRRLLANEPAALAQLSNPEERAAYMYQFWASKQLTVGPAAQNVFERIAAFIRSVLGIWSNDQRALHIMEYFHSGEFATDAQGRAPSDVVSKKLMEVGRNAALEKARRMTEPLLNMGESLMVAGGQRLRDTGIPALRQLADAMKLHGTNEGEDPGFIPAQRAEFAQRMNALAAKLKGVSEAQLLAATESLQTKSNAPIDALATHEQRQAARKAKLAMREHLDNMLDYMRTKGIKVKDMGYGSDYFPRIYDTAYISAHQAEFKAVLAAHGVDADPTLQTIITNEGNEFAVTDKPGMQHLKPRKLAHIPDAELAPFMVKNGLEIMSSYTMQATRRGEWTKRFGDNSQRIMALLVEAEREGATPEQLKAAQNFVRAVDGTLGDTINPEARRLMGNMIVYQNIRLLPLAIFSSVVDPMGVMVRGGTLSESFNTFRRGVREVVKNFKKNATDDDMTRLAEEIGTIDSAMLTQTLSALYLQGMAGSTAKKINDTFFKYNLMEQWTRSSRVGATEAAIGFLTRHATGKKSPHSARWLNELGLQPGDVRLNAQGRAMITQADGLTPAEAGRMKAAVNRWVDGAVLRPDATDKPIWMSDPHWALVAHLKQFVFSFQETILKRVTHEFDHGNYVPAMALSSYVPIMIASDLVKGLIQGGGEQPEWKSGWSLWDYFTNGVARAGLNGTGQFLDDAIGGNVGALTGPTAEQLWGAVQVIGGNAQFDRFALKSMPANALYREAFDGGE